jgi:hypothetical protein
MTIMLPAATGTHPDAEPATGPPANLRQLASEGPMTLRPARGQPVAGRPRLGIGPALFGIRPASSRARRNSNSMWALRLRKSSAAHLARASWTFGSIRSSTCLRSFTDQE